MSSRAMAIYLRWAIVTADGPVVSREGARRLSPNQPTVVENDTEKDQHLALLRASTTNNAGVMALHHPRTACVFVRFRCGTGGRFGPLFPQTFLL